MAEELARKNAELAQANRELEAFSYSVSHDLRAPLRTISAFTHALADDLGGKLEGRSLDHIRRIRFATKGPAVMPMKLLTDEEWFDALCRVVEKGRRLHKEVVLHTHFNHPNEITAITRRALDRLHERGVIVRNQSVLQRGVNDTVPVIQQLVKRLGYCNVQPYYVYVCPPDSAAGRD